MELEEQYQLIQVCEDIGDPQGSREQRGRYKREVGSLEAAMRRCGLECGTIVTLRDQRTLVVDAGRIELVPAWKWCLCDALPRRSLI